MLIRSTLFSICSIQVTLLFTSICVFSELPKKSLKCFAICSCFTVTTPFAFIFLKILRSPLVRSFTKFSMLDSSCIYCDSILPLIFLAFSKQLTSTMNCCQGGRSLGKQNAYRFCFNFFDAKILSSLQH